MDRKIVALGILALIVAIVMISGCTSGPAANPTATPTKAPVVNKTMTNVSEPAPGQGMGGNETPYTGVNPMPSMVNNTTKGAAATIGPTIMPK